MPNKVNKAKEIKTNSDVYEIYLGTFIDNAFTWYSISKFKDLTQAYKEFKKYVNTQLKYTDEELQKVWDTGRLDIELRQGSKLLNWVGIYSRKVAPLSSKEEKEAEKGKVKKKKKKDSIDDDDAAKFERLKLLAITQAHKKLNTRSAGGADTFYGAFLKSEKDSDEFKKLLRRSLDMFKKRVDPNYLTDPKQLNDPSFEAELERILREDYAKAHVESAVKEEPAPAKEPGPEKPDASMFEGIDEEMLAAFEKNVKAMEQKQPEPVEQEPAKEEPAKEPEPLTPAQETKIETVTEQAVQQTEQSGESNLTFNFVSGNQVYKGQIETKLTDMKGQMDFGAFTFTFSIEPKRTTDSVADAAVPEELLTQLRMIVQGVLDKTVAGDMDIKTTGNGFEITIK